MFSPKFMTPKDFDDKASPELEVLFFSVSSSTYEKMEILKGEVEFYLEEYDQNGDKTGIPIFGFDNVSGRKLGDVIEGEDGSYCIVKWMVNANSQNGRDYMTSDITFIIGEDDYLEAFELSEKKLIISSNIRA